MVSRLLVVPLALAVVLAGCIGAGPEPVTRGSTGPSVPTSPPTDENVTDNLTVAASTESLGLVLSHIRTGTYFSYTSGSKNCLDVQFDQNATFVGGIATFTWTAPDSFSQRLEARFYDHSNKTVPVVKAVGPSPLSVELPEWDFTNRSSPRVFIQVPVGETAIVRDLAVKLDFELLYASPEEPIYTTIVCSAAA